MTDEQIILWNRLQSYDLDRVDAALPFSKRLARENGWATDYAKRVIEEYKRFIFLAITSGRNVTPSDEIDQVWHLHLLYTKSYWEDFCKTVLRQPLHHEPTRGGLAEGRKFREWYAETKVSYTAVFGAEPPLDIWRNEQDRFTLAPHFKRINAKLNWIIPKKIVVSLSLFLIVIITLWSCGSNDNHASYNAVGVVIIAIGFISMIAILIFTSSDKQKQKSASDSSGSGCGGGESDSESNGDSGGDSGCGGSGCGGCGS